MKIKSLLNLAIVLSAVVFFACDDDLSSIGKSIQPGDDDIFVEADTVLLTAKTVSFEDSVYARTSRGVLGEYIDPIFGKIKSDFLTEFFCQEDLTFESKDATIDSVSLELYFREYIGESTSPMGISVYEVTSPLKPFFFTSVDPAKYCDMTKLFGQTFFTVQDATDTTRYETKFKLIRTKLDYSLGNKFYQEWKSNPETFKNSENLKKFFKGVYVTTNLGSGNLIRSDFTEFNIHYKYAIKNEANTADSTVFRIFKLFATEEVIQMNRVKNSIPESLYADKDTKTYMKTPAGLYTQLTIPLNKIMANRKDQSINAANLKIKGFTEEEEKSGLMRPEYALLVNKDSLSNFFFNFKINKVDNITTFVIERNTSTNTYNFGNIASIINHYADHYKEETVLPDLEYLIIPISPSYTQKSDGYSSYYELTTVSNEMRPTSAILRTDAANMKMPLIFSKY